MPDDIIFRLGYSMHCERNGVPASPEAEADYRAIVDENRACNRIEEAERHARYAARERELMKRPLVPHPYVKAGRLRMNTHSGTVVHAVMSRDGDNTYEAFGGRAAMCGAAPAIELEPARGKEITCRRCRKKLAEK